MNDGKLIYSTFIKSTSVATMLRYIVVILALTYGTRAESEFLDVGEICLHSPMVDTLHSLTVRSDANTFDISFNFSINRNMFYASNLTYDTNEGWLPKPHNLRLLKRKHAEPQDVKLDNEPWYEAGRRIIYIRNYRIYHANNEEFTKVNHIPINLISEKRKAFYDLCDNLMIAHAAFMIETSEDMFMLTKYQKYLRCSYNLQAIDGGRGIKEINSTHEPINHINAQSNIVAAEYDNKLLLEVSADGILHIWHYAGQSPSPLFGNTYGDASYKRTPFAAMWSGALAAHDLSNVRPMLTSPFCEQKVAELETSFLDPSWIEYDTRYGFPFESILHYNESVFITYVHTPTRNTAFPPNYLAWTRRDSGNYEIGVLVPRIFPACLGLPIYATSSLPNLEVSEQYMICPQANSFGFNYIRPSEDPKNSFFRPYNYTIVNIDDIVHWKTCERVISIYGLMYTMHKSREDILETVTRFQFLPEALGNRPIESAVAIGDDFYFMTRRGRGFMATMDASNCDTLTPISVKPIHYSHLFGHDPKAITFEDRFFMNGAWTPPWSATISDPSRSGQFWIYALLVIFIVLSAIIALVLCLANVNSIFVEPVIYSATKSQSESIRSLLNLNQSKSTGGLPPPKSAGGLPPPKSAGAASRRTPRSPLALPVKSARPQSNRVSKHKKKPRLGRVASPHSNSKRKHVH